MTWRAVECIHRGKLEEVGKRHGATRGRFCFARSADAASGAGDAAAEMTVKFSGEGGEPVDLLATTEIMLRESAEQVVRTMQEVRAGKFGQIKEAQAVMRELRSMFQTYMDERTRVDKLRQQTAGVIRGHAIDFDAARDEIGRRLARLRDA